MHLDRQTTKDSMLKIRVEAADRSIYGHFVYKKVVARAELTKC